MRWAAAGVGGGIGCVGVGGPVGRVGGVGGRVGGTAAAGVVVFLKGPALFGWATFLNVRVS